MESSLLISQTKDGWKLEPNPNWVETFPEYYAHQMLMQNPAVSYVEYEVGGKTYRVILSSKKKSYKV